MITQTRQLYGAFKPLSAFFWFCGTFTVWFSPPALINPVSTGTKWQTEKMSDELVKRVNRTFNKLDIT